MLHAATLMFLLHGCRHSLTTVRSLHCIITEQQITKRKGENVGCTRQNGINKKAEINPLTLSVPVSLNTQLLRTSHIQNKINGNEKMRIDQTEQTT